MIFHFIEDILWIIENEIKRLGINVIYNCLVEDISKENDKFIIKCSNNSITCDNVVLACGSKAYPKTGSDGMGYTFLKEFGHNIIKPLPALTSIIGDKPYFKDWAGIRVDAKVSLYENNKYMLLRLNDCYIVYLLLLH